MSNQEEALSKVVKSVQGEIYVTQPAKSVKTKFSDYLDDVIELYDNNEPYTSIVAESNEGGALITIITKSNVVFRALPTFSSNAFNSLKLVSHIEVSDFDFSIVTSLRDLGLSVLISHTIDESINFAKLAYNLAERFQKPVFHFFAPSSGSSSSRIQSLDNVLLSNLQQYSYSEIVSQLGAEYFTILEKGSSADFIVLLGQPSPRLLDSLRNENVTVASVNIYQPFALQELLKIIPSRITTLAFLQQTTKSFSSVSPLLLDFFSKYSELSSPKNFSNVLVSQLGFVKPEKYESIVTSFVANIRSEHPIQNLVFGDAGAKITTKSLIKSTEKHQLAVGKARTLEDAYVKILQQINQTNLHVLNDFNSESTGTASNPEYGFGAYLLYEEKQKELLGLVCDAIQKNSLNSIDNVKLFEILTVWVSNVRSNSDVSNTSVAEIVQLLETDSTSEDASDILNLKEYFEVKQNWIIGSDAWSFDLGSSGVHNIISSGKNVKMLIIDSTPYSAESKTPNPLRKKDVGLYAMNYGNCYVASVAVYSSYTQVLQAFIEASKFNGPSVVLAYLPYKSEFDNTLEVLKETKIAVDSGYWPLYRFNPAVTDETESFKLDSSNLRSQLKDFLDRQNKLTLLAKENPELSRNITANAGSEKKRKQVKIADDAFTKLVSSLSGPPLTIAFASDGGNAEGVAKKINRQALAKGLKSAVIVMDDLTIEDLSNEKNIVFITSTSGQGEFPTNGKQFWDSLKGSVDLDISTVRFSTFGLGDSQYWPRKEDKHYYNKPAKDLHAKLLLYGGAELTDIGLGDSQDADDFNTGLNEWLPKIWKALGVDNVEGAEEPKALTNEDMKLSSDYLRGTIVSGLADQSTGAISAVDQQLTKFHGIYMQDDRDVRVERKAQGLEPAYAFMVRARLPGGIATPEQYLRIDELSDTRGNGTLKITTRATFQLHGIVKHNLKPTIRGMNAVLMDTLAACGDVNRNVVVTALPHKAKIHAQVSAIGAEISEYLLPSTTAYHEIWLEGQEDYDKAQDFQNWETRKNGPKKKKTLVAGNSLVDFEPLYGTQYLPRKFKIVITVPPYNDVDVYANDIGLIAVVEEDEVLGFNFLVGGGMGTTHNNKKTYPRLGSMFGYLPKDKINLACEKIMLVQRDFGDRTNRKHARLKYTIDDMGVDTFKGKVEDLLGFKFEKPKAFEITSNVDYFGWCKDEYGFNHFTVFIENGRVEDTPELPQKTGLKKLAEYLKENNKSGEFRLTGNQHVVVSNIKDEDLEEVKAILSQYKLSNTNFSALRLSSASCVGFPTCGLAMAESERYMPELTTKLELILEEYGLRHDSIVMRMTGCPNGCARPWVAEIALVGKAPGAYNLMLGGGHHGQRLNKIFRYSIDEDEIISTLRPLFKRWSLERDEGEPFGDFCIRTGVIKPTLEGKYFHDDIPEDA